MQFKGQIVAVKSWGETSDGEVFCSVWAADDEGVGWVCRGLFTALPQVGDVLEGDFLAYMVTDPLWRELQSGGPHVTEHLKVVTWDSGNPSLSTALRGLADYLEDQDIPPQHIVDLSVERYGQRWKVRLVIPNRAYR